MGLQQETATGTCRTCRREIPLDEAGLCREHDDTTALRCPGSDVPPVSEETLARPSAGLLGGGVCLLMLLLIGVMYGLVGEGVLLVLLLAATVLVTLGVTRLAGKIDRL